MYHFIVWAIVILFSFILKRDGYPLYTGAAGFNETHWPAYRGIYLDDSSLVGDTAKENEVLRWCKQNHFNVLSVYNLKKVVREKKFVPLREFVKRAKTVYGMQEVSAIFELDSIHVKETIDSLNKNTSDILQRFNYYNFELEWWNGAASFPDYIKKLTEIRAMGSAQTPVIKTEEYIGWFGNPLGQDSMMAAELVKNSDQILVHDYQKVPSLEYFKERIDWIGRAAKAQNKIMPVIIIFSAESDFSGDYFLKHNFHEAFERIMKEFSAASFEGKKNIDIIGYQIFALSQARLSRP